MVDEKITALEALEKLATIAFTHTSNDVHSVEDNVVLKHTVKTEIQRLYDDLRFLWKTIERAKWQPEIYGTMENAINNMVLYPNAPWNNKEMWDWDTSHKSYDDEIKKFTGVE